MEGGRGGYPLVPGSSWAQFEGNAKEYESLSGWPGASRHPLSPTAGRLCREDMAIYGEEPALDSLSLVVCKQCERVIKSQALLKHKELYHSESIQIPIPRRLSQPPFPHHQHHQPHFPPSHHPHLLNPAQPMPIHTIGQPSNTVRSVDADGSDPFGGTRPGEHSPGAGGSEAMFLATNLPRDKEGGGGGSKSSKEYDPDRHCGVWLENDNRHCTRSLACKFHSLSLRRKVPSRSKPFNELFDLHKKRKKLKKRERGRLNSETLAPSSPLQSPTARVPPQPSIVDPVTSPPGGPTPSPPTLRHGFDDIDCASFPRPIAVCSFGSRSSGSGSLVFCRRQDSLRSALASLSGRDKDYTKTTLHRKHSRHSLLKHKAVQRKYYSKQNDILPERSRSLLDPALRHPSTLTPVQLPAALTPTQTGAATFAQSPTHTPTLGPHHPPTLTPMEPQAIPTPQFYGLANGSNVAEGLLSSPSDIAPQPVSDPLPDSDPRPPQKKPEKSGKKSKSKRGRRPKSGQRRQSDSRRRAVEEEPASEETPVVNNSDGVGLPGAPLDSETVQKRTSNATSDVPANTTPPRTSVDQHSVQQGSAPTPPLPLPPGGLVTVKQEPFSNHEDEMDLERQAAGGGGGGGGAQLWPHPHHRGSPQSALPKSNASKPHSLVLNGMIAPSTPSRPALPSLHSFNSLSSPQGTFVINPTSQHRSSPGHPLVTSFAPRMSSILPIRGAHGASQSPTHHHLPQPQHQQQPVFTFGQAPPPPPLPHPHRTSPAHLPQNLPLHNVVLPELQRHVMQQNAALWLANNSASAPSPHLATTESGLPGRQAVFPQQQQQVGGALSANLLAAAKGVRIGGGSGNIGNISPSGINSALLAHSRNTQQQQRSPVSSMIQIAASSSPLNVHRASPASKVRAPISRIPPDPSGQDSLQRNLPPETGGSPIVMNQSPLQSKQNLTPQRSHLPSQQVT